MDVRVENWITVNCEGPQGPEPQIFPLGGLLNWGLCVLSSLNECSAFSGVFTKRVHQLLLIGQ